MNYINWFFNCWINLIFLGFNTIWLRWFFYIVRFRFFASVFMKPVVLWFSFNAFFGSNIKLVSEEFVQNWLYAFLWSWREYSRFSHIYSRNISRKFQESSGREFFLWKISFQIISFKWHRITQIVCLFVLNEWTFISFKDFVYFNQIIRFIGVRLVIIFPYFL